eukprot:SAG11_NODE_42025_length_186_cov_14.551724_1_plen_52_part_01
MLTECVVRHKRKRRKSLLTLDTASQIVQKCVRPNIEIIASQPVVLQYFVVRK